MRFPFVLLPLSQLSTTVIALGPHVQIPQVSSAVQHLMSEFSAWPAYAGPTSSVSSNPSSPSPIAGGSTYWLEDINHQGLSPFNEDDAYIVFRNVKDYGAVGDGVTDDTAAINMAMDSGGRCAPGNCQSSTLSPAVVYFPAGTYLISSGIKDYYYTQMIGNPNDPPTLKATANFAGFGLIDGDYYSTAYLAWTSTNVFYRQVRNLVFDMTSMPSESKATGIHWPTAQATSLQNVVFNMSDAPGTQHQGIFVESGSGGFMNDLVFYGGLNAAVFGNQQFSLRNLTFYNAVTAIDQIWDWSFTYRSISIYNCSVGFAMNALAATGSQDVGSVTFIDSSMTDTVVAFVTSHNSTSTPASAGSLIIENVQLTNVSVAIQGPGATTVLEGVTGSTTLAGWGQGHSYSPSGPVDFEGPITPLTRPAPLIVSDGRYYERSKPQYGTTPVSMFMSVRSGGAVGDGVTDDTAALQRTIIIAAFEGKVVFFDYGIYKVTTTLYFPQNSKIVGESYPVIMSSGSYFSNMNNPQPVVRVGLAGEVGVIEWSDMLVSTQGAQAGAVLIEWNLASPGTPSGMWDVHTRIGGFQGSGLQLAQCPTTATIMTPPAPINAPCVAAYMAMHVTHYASGLYLENVWLWTADHDQDDPQNTQITVYAGRGMYIESAIGTIWLVGTAVEHHTLYQYQFANTQNIYMGLIQTETAYYQPNPNATEPFPPVAAYSDPDFTTSCAGKTGNCANGWGLRILNAINLLIYGAGHYSFFDNYSTACSDAGAGETCQTRIVSIEGTSSDIYVYNLNTIGSVNMVTQDGSDLANQGDNTNVYPDTIAIFKSS
ncbi:MAG: hypothetical protein M1827_002982 [Pycnora praestabilis]|nr:MAG: hypothetical protein M1827_002982 [Pycnora praestabilis]